MARVRTTRVLGKIVGPDGEPSMAGSLTLFPSERSMSVTSVPVRDGEKQTLGVRLSAR